MIEQLFDSFAGLWIYYSVAESITQSFLNHEFQGEQDSYPLSSRLSGFGPQICYPVHKPNLQTNQSPPNFFLAPIAAKKISDVSNF